MHRRAEYGVAAHWKYKEDGRAGVDTDRSRSPTATASDDMAWLRQLMDWQRETEDPGEFLDSLRFEINSTEVYVFTPRGDVIALPTGSTPVDFAYAVHTEVGHRCIGARVNGRLVPLERTLDNGDVVEVFTSKAQDAGPSRDWLTFVKSPRARNKIKQWFTKERREEAIEQGKDAHRPAMRKQGLPLQRMLTHETLSVRRARAALRRRHRAVRRRRRGQHDRADRRTPDPRAVRRRGRRADEAAETVTITSERERRKRSPRGDPGVVVKGATDVWVKLARCCTPVPGDEIVGFVTRGDGVSVHRGDCANVEEPVDRSPDRMVEVEWAPTAAVDVPGRDPGRGARPGPAALATSPGCCPTSTSTSCRRRSRPRRDRVAKSRFTFEMADPTHLGHVLKAVRSVDGVFDAYRVTQ